MILVGNIIPYIRNPYIRNVLIFYFSAIQKTSTHNHKHKAKVQKQEYKNHAEAVDLGLVSD